MTDEKQRAELIWPVPDILTWVIQGDTLEKWRRYLAHDRTNPSRVAMYNILDARLADARWPQSLVEVGFGPCIDFGGHFCDLQDKDQIVYTGYDITEHFVKFAREDYPGYDFRLGGFRDLKETYDISFTRHTLQHLNPVLLEPSLRALLRAARALTIITWRMAPGHRHIVRKPESKQRPAGCWVNTYDQKAVLEIIRDEGFYCEMQDCRMGGDRDVIYILERHG